MPEAFAALDVAVLAVHGGRRPGPGRTSARSAMTSQRRVRHDIKMLESPLLDDP